MVMPEHTDKEYSHSVPTAVAELSVDTTAGRPTSSPDIARTEEVLVDDVMVDDSADVLDSSTVVVVEDVGKSIRDFASADAMAQSFTVKELKQMAIDNGVAAHGKKTDICERLLACRQVTD